MKRAGFAMQLKEGCEAEYKKRHDELWPELAKALSEAGVRDYVIYLDPKTNVLYASQKVTDHNTADQLPENPIVRKWWAFMADLMETNPDDSPVVWDLNEMFYLD
jgi:L-rhamnose mutarotase